MATTPTMEMPSDGVWKHSFDSMEHGDGGPNPGLGMADAFLTFMEEDGIPADRVAVAVVLHARAIADVTTAGATDADPNPRLVARILAAGGEIWVCGRSARAQGVGDGDLLPGVEFAPSAMIAHAELQRRGFSINPY